MNDNYPEWSPHPHLDGFRQQVGRVIYDIIYCIADDVYELQRRIEMRPDTMHTLAVSLFTGKTEDNFIALALEAEYDINELMNLGVINAEQSTH